MDSTYPEEFCIDELLPDNECCVYDGIELLMHW
jgi:hypothetical protein